MVFPIGFKICWQYFKHVYYCRIHFSHSPFPIGWYGVLRVGLTPVILGKRLNSLLSNYLLKNIKNVY